MRAKRVDANHGAIRDTLRRLGWRILDVSDCAGLCDLLAHRGGILRMVEVKTAKGTLTARQQELMAEGWPIVIVRSVEDALRLR